jgi:hypothetical protein
MIWFMDTGRSSLFKFLPNLQVFVVLEGGEILRVCKTRLWLNAYFLLKKLKYGHITDML